MSITNPSFSYCRRPLLHLTSQVIPFERAAKNLRHELFSKGSRELLMVAFLAPQIPLAFLVARTAVARARRGDVPDWSGLAWPGLRSGALPRPSATLPVAG